MTISLSNRIATVKCIYLGVKLVLNPSFFNLFFAIYRLCFDENSRDIYHTPKPQINKTKARSILLFTLGYSFYDTRCVFRLALLFSVYVYVIYVVHVFYMLCFDLDGK